MGTALWREARIYFRLFFYNLSAHADGERRGPDCIGGWRRKDLGEARLQVRSGRHGSSAFAVGVPREVVQKIVLAGRTRGACERRAIVGRCAVAEEEEEEEEGAHAQRRNCNNNT